MLREVPAWRVAWKHPNRSHWVLGLYEYTDLQMAEEMAEFLRTWKDQGTKAALIPCRATISDHGVNR